MDHDWGDAHRLVDDGHGDEAETGDLQQPTEPLDAAQIGAYDEPPPGPEAGDDADTGLAPVGGADYPDDDPMGDFDARPGPDLGAERGPDVAADADAGAADADGRLEAVVGADPDVDPSADWEPAGFPEELGLQPPEPVDGYPWSDSATLGDGVLDEPTAGVGAAPPVDELLDYAGLSAHDGDPWAALVDSDDPAASALGRWWAPGG
jgi:hypothetical protein